MEPAAVPSLSTAPSFFAPCPRAWHERLSASRAGCLRALAGLLVSPQVTEDLEDALAIAERERRKAVGRLGEGVSHEEVGRLLGLVTHVGRTA
ncbi:hypothetical protein [Streptomyces armeniacus]|nr:hypothetical protein [Streptomyces armeniacus]